MNAAPSRANALAAAVLALLERGEYEHARVFVRELHGLLEQTPVHGGTDPQETAYITPEHPKNPVVHMESPPVVVESPVARSESRKPAKSGRERMALCRARKKAQVAESRDGRQLELVTRDVTIVTPVTDRHVTRAASDLSSERPTKGLSGERRDSQKERDGDGVTVTPPEQLDERLRDIFDVELAKRPGVTFDPEWLWGESFLRKTADFGVKFASRGHLETLWARWCRNEKPRNEKPIGVKKTAAPESRSQAVEPAPSSSTPASKAFEVDPVERSLRVAEAARERAARESAEWREKSRENAEESARLLETAFGGRRAS